ncbi:membrane protein insertion efficiency factor YidD [Oerskovia flava]|uniref:membrane protein insertion efficiency factor YidD n=1 Tax=Oerskovia flava TaxID=2986422 RepID=UPI002AD2933A|nr:membrane protein insertion efficiency factor YidD [Oerskovia sp. JB1-3-2]
MTAAVREDTSREDRPDDQDHHGGPVRRCARLLMRLPGLVVVALIRGYQMVISPMTGPTCKYYPSCSHYALEAVRRHGVVRGGGLAVWRLLRCNPWSRGGVDDVPDVREKHPH